MWTGLAIIWALCALATSANALSDPQVVEALRAHVEGLRRTGGLALGGSEIAAKKVLPRLYEHRAFEPAWLAPGRADAVIAAVEARSADGLDPEDYHLRALRGLRKALRDPSFATPTARARYDLLLSDAVARMVYHLEFGKVDPQGLDPNWNLVRSIDGMDPDAILGRIVAADSIEAAIQLHRPQHASYKLALTALAEYQAIRLAGGWQPVPEGPALKPGAVGERVAALRRRLAVTGDLATAAGSASDAIPYDASLEAAVANFQARQYLEADGVAGNDTLAALNVPLQARLDQLRVNLERARWVLHDLPSEYVMVDIAGFQATLVRRGETVWRSRVQVGRPYRKTPVFKAEIRYLDINPTWTIPPGILQKDTLPAVRRDASYLANRNIRLFDANGEEVDSLSVDWSRYTGGYRFVQDPGPNNALGRVKFMFPNPHFVFLHDTPSRSLFERNERAFSSGCIRVERPFELVRWLLDDDTKWDADAIQRVVDSRKTETVLLPRRVPVILMYWTIDLREDQRVGFKRDLYERDGAVLEALAGDFVVHRVPGE